MRELVRKRSVAPASRTIANPRAQDIQPYSWTVSPPPAADRIQTRMREANLADRNTQVVENFGGTYCLIDVQT
jgi:hypothetical protein